MGNPLYNVSPGLLRSFRRLFGIIREGLFTKEYDESRFDMRIPIDNPTEDDLDRVENVLGNAHFTNAWELSWHYKSEDLNMRRPKRYDDEYEWYQTHVRVFLRDDGLYFEIHEDLEPTEYPYLHLHPPEDGSQSTVAAVEDTGQILRNAGLDTETNWDQQNS